MTKTEDEKNEATAATAVKLGDTLAAVSGGASIDEAVKVAEAKAARKAEIVKAAREKLSADRAAALAAKQGGDKPEPKVEPVAPAAPAVPTEVTVSANANKVHFGRDKHGLTQALRKAGLDAAGRVQGSEEKLRTLVHTLNVLKLHAIARYKRQLGVKRDFAARVTEREENEKRVRAEQRKAAIATAEAHLKALKGE